MNIKFTKENKLYFLIFAGIIIYAITSAMQNVIFKLLQITNQDIIPITQIIYQIICILLAIIYILKISKLDIEEMKKTLKKHALGLSSILIYLILNACTAVPLKLLNINIQLMSQTAKIIYSLCYEIIILILLISLNKTKLKNDLQDIKKNHKKYFKENIKYWFIGLIIMYITNFIIQFIFLKEMPNNEELIRQQFQLSPLYMYISAVLIGPLIEEIVFRLSIKNLIKNEYLFMIISGLIFGALHAFNAEKITIIEILYLIPYSTLGVAFAKMLNNTKNIYVSTAIHMLHNGILMGIQFLTYFYL